MSYLKVKNASTPFPFFLTSEGASCRRVWSLELQFVFQHRCSASVVVVREILIPAWFELFTAVSVLIMMSNTPHKQKCA